MDAALHAIQGLTRRVELGPTSFDNFALGPGEAVSSRVALEPGWTIYCVDVALRQALFLEIPPEADLAEAPFVFLMQERLARRALVVPFAALGELAEAAAGAGAGGAGLQHRALRVDAHERDAERGRGGLEPVGAGPVLRPGDAPPPAGSGRGSRAAACLPSVELPAAEGAAGEHNGSKAAGAVVVPSGPVPRRDAGCGLCLPLSRRGELGAIVLVLPAQLRGPRVLDGEELRSLWWILTAAADFAALGPFLDPDGSVPVERTLAPFWAMHIEAYRRLLAAGVPFLAVSYAEIQSDPEAVMRRVVRHSGLPDTAVERALQALGRDFAGRHRHRARPSGRAAFRRGRGRRVPRRAGAVSGPHAGHEVAGRLRLRRLHPADQPLDGAAEGLGAQRAPVGGQGQDVGTEDMGRAPRAGFARPTAGTVTAVSGRCFTCPRAGGRCGSAA